MSEESEKKIIASNKVRVNQLLDLIGLDTINDIIKPLDADKNVWQLTTVVMIKLIKYYLLETNRLSLRSMEFNYDYGFQPFNKRDVHRQQHE